MTLRTRLRELSLVPALVAFALLARALVVLEQPYEINHDSATLLHVAQLLLDGRLPYLEIFETNPPMSWSLPAERIPIGGASSYTAYRG